MDGLRSFNIIMVNVMDPIFNLKVIRERLAAEDLVHNEMDDITFKRLYIGSIPDLLPSGKLYAPWSSSITEEDAEKDLEWYEQAERELAGINAFLESGEGDGCDLFIIQVVA